MRIAPVAVLLVGLLITSSCQSAPSAEEIAQTEAAAATANGWLTATQDAWLTATVEMERATSQAMTAAAPTATETPVPTPTLNQVHFDYLANACWVDTGVQIKAGQVVTIEAQGLANTWDGKDISNGGPDGQPKNMCGDVSCPLLGANYGTLIGRIGEGKPFEVGSNLELTAAEDGSLFLTINDWSCEDNSGNFVVTITIR